jgi:hypothetical protein
LLRLGLMRMITAGYEVLPVGSISMDYRGFAGGAARMNVRAGEASIVQLAGIPQQVELACCL